MRRADLDDVNPRDTTTIDIHLLDNGFVELKITPVAKGSAGCHIRISPSRVKSLQAILAAIVAMPLDKM